MLPIINRYGKANQNYKEISSHTGQNGHHQKIWKQTMLEKVEGVHLTTVFQGSLLLPCVFVLALKWRPYAQGEEEVPLPAEFNTIAI